MNRQELLAANKRALAAAGIDKHGVAVNTGTSEQITGGGPNIGLGPIAELQSLANSPDPGLAARARRELALVGVLPDPDHDSYDPRFETPAETPPLEQQSVEERLKNAVIYPPPLPAAWLKTGYE